MCCLLVSAFLTEITQQIHSLRASGVISSHFARAAESEMRTFRKSAGTLCTAPGEIAFLVIDLILRRYAIRVDVPIVVLTRIGFLPNLYEVSERRQGTAASKNRALRRTLLST